MQFFDEEKNSWVESSDGINEATEYTTGKRKKRSNVFRNQKRKRDSNTLPNELSSTINSKSSVVSMDFSADSSSLDTTIQENESIASSTSTEELVTAEASSSSSSSSSTLSNFQSELRLPREIPAITSTPKSIQPIEILDSDEETPEHKRMRLDRITQVQPTREEIYSRNLTGNLFDC